MAWLKVARIVVHCTDFLFSSIYGLAFHYIAVTDFLVYFFFLVFNQASEHQPPLRLRKWQFFMEACTAIPMPPKRTCKFRARLFFFMALKSGPKTTMMAHTTCKDKFNQGAADGSWSHLARKLEKCTSFTTINWQI